MRPFLAFALLLPGLATPACGSSSDAPAAGVAMDAPGGGPRPRIRVVDGVNMDVRDVPLLMAFDELRSQGYDVESRYIAGNTLLADALARGDAEVGIINNLTAWSAVATGADIKTVSDFTSYTGLVATHAGVRSCRDLHGRPLAIPVTTGFSPLLFNLVLRTECPGVAPEILVVAEASSRAAALLAGRIDAALVPGEELLKLEAAAPGRFRALLVTAASYPDIRVDGLQIRGDWGRRHPEAVRALVAAQLKAHRLIRARPEVLYREAAVRLSLDDHTARSIADTHLSRDIWDPNGALTPDNMASTIAFLSESDALPSELTPADVADLSYLDAVLDEIGRVPSTAPEGAGRAVSTTAR